MFSACQIWPGCQFTWSCNKNLQVIPANLMFVIADVIIVWRAWAVWPESRITKFCLVILVLIDMGINIVDGVLDTKVMELGGDDNISWDWIYVAVNLAVNTIATLLVAYRAWTHHHSIRAVSCHRKTQVQAILLLFIESGAFFAVIQVLYIVITALSVNGITNSPVDIGTLFLTSLYLFTSAINPVAIVILVHTENTYEHSFHLDDVPSLPVQSIEVADGPLRID